jgi:hypothetical protein
MSNFYSRPQFIKLLLGFTVIGQLLCGCAMFHPVNEHAAPGDVSSTAAGSPAIEGTAQVMAVRGKAWYSTNSIDWTPMNVGTNLGSKTTIKTGPINQVCLSTHYHLQNITIKASSIVALKTLTYRDPGKAKGITTDLELLEGGVLGCIGKIPGGSRFEVSTPSGIRMRVKRAERTEFVISAEGEISVFTGTVNVYYEDEKGSSASCEVRAGWKFCPATKNEPARRSKITAESEDAWWFRLK